MVFSLLPVEFYTFQVVWHIQFSFIVQSAFCCIEGFSAFDVVILGMVQDEVRYIEISRQFTGLTDGAVVLLIWIVLVPLRIQTKGSEVSRFWRL